MIKLFIGYDSHEITAYHTLCNSIIRHASIPVSITPLALNNLHAFFKRQRDEHSSTEFSFSRFLVPWLSQYQGISIFMDCDMIVTRDIKQLVDNFDERFAVQVVKHDYTPKTAKKFLGQTQSQYEKKNWSSVMLFNNEKCHALTPKVVESESGLFLHQFKWLESEELIGELPPEWNFLVGEYQQPEITPALVHYTLGGPWFDECKSCDYDELWLTENRLMTSSKNRIHKSATEKQQEPA